MPNLLDLIYALVLLLAFPWLLWESLRKGKYREGFAAKFLGRVPRRQRPGKSIWLHAVSVGEVNVLGPLVTRLQQRFPDRELVISTTTRTGYQLARKKYAGLHVCYCPLDFTWATREAVARLRPALLVLVELELWPNLIRAAQTFGAPVVVVNGRLSERSFAGYRRIGALLRPMMRCLDCVAAQDPAYADRFIALGADAARVHVTGSVKFDGAETDRRNPHTRRLATLAGIADGDVVFLAGSTQETEEAAALEAYRQHAPANPHLRLVLVPRHPDRFDSVAAMLEQSGLRFQRRTRLEAEGPDPAARILLVDAVGELGAWWGTAHIGFVGGSLTHRGGQNMIEPAAYGAAVSFGPNTHNFRDVVQRLLAAEAACVVRDTGELTAFVGRCLAEPDDARQLGRRAQQLVASQLGATERTIELLAQLLPEAASQRLPVARRCAV